jgi:hypothetical protein
MKKYATETYKSDIDLLYNSIAGKLGNKIWDKIPDSEKKEEIKNIIESKSEDPKERKKVLDFLYSHREKIPSSERQNILEDATRDLLNWNRSTKMAFQNFKEQYGISYKKFFEPTIKEKFSQFAKEELPGYGISVGSGVPIGTIGYFLEEKLKTQEPTSEGIMVLLSLLSSYGSEFLTGKTQKYETFGEHISERIWPIIYKGGVSFITANLFKNLLKKITKSQ